jgi:hypothetical protein
MRRLTIATILCILGVCAYLHWSEGPAKVHGVTILTNAIFLFGLCAAAWLGPLNRKWRFAACATWTALAAALGPILDSNVISAMVPLHPIYFLQAFLFFAIEGASFLLCVWLADRGLPRKFSGQSHMIC